MHLTWIHSFRFICLCIYFELVHLCVKNRNTENSWMVHYHSGPISLILNWLILMSNLSIVRIVRRRPIIWKCHVKSSIGTWASHWKWMYEWTQACHLVSESTDSTIESICLVVFGAKKLCGLRIMDKSQCCKLDSAIFWQKLTQ